MSSLAVAREVGVSDASIIRFSRAIGYKGFADLKNDLHSNLTQDVYKRQCVAFALHNINFYMWIPTPKQRQKSGEHNTAPPACNTKCKFSLLIIAYFIKIILKLMIQVGHFIDIVKI